MTGTPCLESISPKLQRIAELARRTRSEGLTTLAHHIDLTWLKAAVELTNKKAAKGVDGVTAEMYCRDLEGNLSGLLQRIKDGSYRAPPVRRVHIPKADGKETRPIGIPTFEDKVAQRAIALVLEAVYEQEFLDCSYGFRVGRSAHQALSMVRTTLMDWHGGWVLEIDIRKFFDTLVHEHLMQVLRQRVRDGVVLRMVAKWLHAGVMEGLELSFPEAGTPQGGVVSPILANIYLHEVLDVWFEQVVRPRMQGRCRLVRYADDAVLLFENEQDAKRALEVLPKRFEKYGLTLHAEKTRLVAFKRPSLTWQGGPGGPGTFDLLGFTHYWARSCKGTWAIMRKTIASRFRRRLKRTSQWLAAHRHRHVSEQAGTLRRMLKGYFNYFGIVGNGKYVWQFRRRVEEVWKKWLGRRSQRGYLSWAKMHRILGRYPLPVPGRLVLV